MFYAIHVHEGINFTAFGPFKQEEDVRAFRTKYGDDEQDDGSIRAASDLPRLPYLGIRDNCETDAWLLVYGNRFELLDGWPIINPSDYEHANRSQSVERDED